MARAIATPWRWPPDSSPTSASGERRCKSTAAMAATASVCIRWRSSQPQLPMRHFIGSPPPKKGRAELAAEKDVPRDAHARNPRVVLMDGFYAQAHRVFRRTDVPRLAQKLDRAGIRAVRARKDLDQGRLAGTVVAEQADDLPLPDVEADIAQRVHARVPLVQSGAADQHILARPRLDRSLPWRPGCDARRRAAAGRQ